MTPKALDNPLAPVVTLDQTILERGYLGSRTSPRKRLIQPIQRTQEAPVQRLLNFLQPETYVQPHRHPLPDATESLLWISGELEVLVFSDEGRITDRLLLDSNMPMIDIASGVWHGMIVRAEDTLIFEVKKGPYNPETDKEFASWAPPEGSSESLAYLHKLSDVQKSSSN